MSWSVYMILCSDSSLYTGITTDVGRRFRQHASQKGAKYFRRCQPRYIVFIEEGHSRGSAARRERAIKQLSRDGKLQLIAEYPDSFDDDKITLSALMLEESMKAGKF